MTKHLFNEYEAFDKTLVPLVDQAFKKVDELVRSLFKEFPDVPTREIEAVLHNDISLAASEIRLRRAFEKRKSDREANGAPLERGAE